MCFHDQGETGRCPDGAFLGDCRCHHGYDAAGQPTILVDRVPDAKGILAVHDAGYLEGVRPGQVKQLGGGIQTFLNFLREQ